MSDNSKDSKSHQLASHLLAKEFGEINVLRTADAYKILFTVLMEPTGTEAEGWQTGVALDASASMKAAWSRNEIEPFARKMIAYLAANLDADGKTTVIYWACGDGSQLEVVGDLSAEECEKTMFRGPQKISLGTSTILAPAMWYFVEKFKTAKHGMYIFITDGKLYDLPKVKSYTLRLCKDIAAGKRNPVKCVLIGLGDQIDEAQMEELDDLESNTDIDIWDHKIAKDMRSLVEIFAEVVGENQIVAPTARIYDDKGQLIKNFTDGLPAKVSFNLPLTSAYFELEVMGRRIRQTIVAGT